MNGEITDYGQSRDQGRKGRQRAQPAEEQLAFADLLTERPWPAHERFPYNHDGRTAGLHILSDLSASRCPLLITGYTSLDRIVDFLANCYTRREEYESVRILLGHEPTPTGRTTFPFAHHGFSQEIADYWLNHGFSILLCAKVLAAIEMLQTGLVDVRTSDVRTVHAKIYVGDDAVTIGSSNFSWAGLGEQGEGNVRFVADHGPWFTEARQLAERVWEEGRPYLHDLIVLLERLLRVVSWQEALARACAELLEGEWARRYIPPRPYGDVLPLWPSQETGIAEAIWMIENVGGVLVADATGSGKTRMGAHLLKGVMNRLWATGRMRAGQAIARDGFPVLICPPSVQEAWERESMACTYPLATYSHGFLSHPSSSQHELMRDAIRHAQVLAVDEAHNYLRQHSGRTRALYSNMADYVVLFTATPINRGRDDLLAIIDLLGGDNFDDEVLEIVERIWKRRGNPNDTMSAEEWAVLRQAIGRFTLRRTKTMLNTLIDEVPDSYTNHLGQPCRYPNHHAQTYPCNEMEGDCSLADTIRAAAGRLRGVINLRAATPLGRPTGQRLD